MKRTLGLLATMFALVLAAGGLAACGDDGGGDDDSAESTEDEATDEEATDEEATDDEDGGDEVDAEDIVITEDDLPGDDFVVNEEAADSTRLDDAIAGCADEDEADAFEEATTSDAEGLDFEDEVAQLAVSSRVTVLDDEDLAVELFDLVTGECVGEALSDGYNEDLSEADFDSFGVTREPLPDAPGVDDEVGGFRFTLDGESAEESLQIVSDYVVVQQGGTVAYMLFTGIDGEFPSDDAEALVELVADRMS